MKLKVVVCALVTLSVAAAFPAPGAAADSTFTNTTPPIAVGKFADTAEISEMLRQAEAYASGDGVKKDPKKAFKLHRKAADMGSARAMCLLGLDYADGVGTKKDAVEAVKWLRKSAEEGWPSAQHDLAMCYAMGNVPNKTASDAIIWYRKAAEQGLPDSEAALGVCYLEGVGAPKDIPQGVYWTRRAAEKGFAPAQRYLGICYTKGNGVPKDLVLAYKWLNLAAAKDDMNSDEIRVNLSSAERFMTPEQIAEGQRLAHDFKAKPIPLPGEPVKPYTEEAAAAQSATEVTNSPAVTPTPVPVPPPAPVHTVTATPAPAAAPAHTAKIGVVLVKCDDHPSAEVLVDSAFVGNPPAKLKLPAGPHVIEVKKSGYKGYKREINVTEDAELSLNAVLEVQ